MLIYHENLAEEAQHVTSVLANVYKLQPDTEQHDFSEFYVQEELKGGRGTFFRELDWWHATPPRKIDGQEINEHRLLLSQRDIYVKGHSNSIEDWAFGYSWGRFIFISVARIRGKDSVPMSELQVPRELYLNRLAWLTVHELGHSIVRGEHFQNAVWCKTDTEGKIIQEMHLGNHCTDPRCAMYEVVDLHVKPNEFMLLGEEKRHDAGMDELLERRYPDWFCMQCMDVAQKGDDKRPLATTKNL